ncbi:MAG: hypothetical protein JFR24_03200 [Muribaculaceae bacterium]|jgi:hypothetical protein|nr:hypothetical protein [Muribaculaceae bacterium]MCI9117471.1 hypothetical protein [Muribaculaceae bacterium]
MEDAFDITEYFNSLISQTGSIDMAEAEFKRAIAEDNELHTIYREWCHENGSSERNGFLDFCDEYMESQDSKWDSLNDYDE